MKQQGEKILIDKILETFCIQTDLKVSFNFPFLFK